MKNAPKKGNPASPKTAHKSLDQSVIKSRPFLITAAVLLLGVCAAYFNHFNNPFHFDDDHTIVTNKWIRQLDSFPKYFTDARTTSSLPRNQAYRPGVTVLHAIDYHLSIDTTSKAAVAKLDSAQKVGQRQTVLNTMLQPTTHAFHVHMFIGFILSGFLLFFVLLHIFKQAKPDGKWNEWLALFGMGWFWLHTANAETINYISARSDSASTFWILLTFVVYFYSKLARKFHLYLLPMIIGFFIKEPAIMFAPLMVFFLALFDKNEKPLRKNMLPIISAFVVAIILFKISRSYTPTTWTSGGTDPWHYLLTEAFVIVHYVINFIFPVNLSADTDWTPVTRALDDKVIAGVAVIGLMIWIMIRCWKKPEWRPVSFGIIWFFIALAPTSSIFPFAEVLNDHRTYFPYIGLIISTVWAAGLWLSKLSEQHVYVKKLGMAAGALLLLANGIGAYERCDVWSSGNKLWADCVKKSPNNGRAWMHYGMSLFNKGNDARTRGVKDSIQIWYDSADVCYNKANYFLPYYSYLNINWGVLRQWEGRMTEAEQLYRKALSFDSENPEAYYFLGDFLRVIGKNDEAYSLAGKGLTLSPDHERLKGLYASLAGSNPYTMLKNYENIVKGKPSATDYVNLSLAYYNTYNYQKVVEASEAALKLDSTSYLAWNNMCSAENQMGDYVSAIKAGLKATAINPDFAQGKANLVEALRCQNIVDSLMKKFPKDPTADDYVNLSLLFYNSAMYAKAADAAAAALKIKPNYALAYNNMCTSYNKLSWFEQAVEAGKSAVAASPEFEMARNNLNAALLGLESQAQMKKLAGY